MAHHVDLCQFYHCHAVKSCDHLKMTKLGDCPKHLFLLLNLDLHQIQNHYFHHQKLVANRVVLILCHKLLEYFGLAPEVTTHCTSPSAGINAPFACIAQALSVIFHPMVAADKPNDHHHCTLAQHRYHDCF